MKNIIASISFTSHDSSACVMVDGNIELFFQAERITRIKNGSFLNTTDFQPILKITNYIDCLVFVSTQHNFATLILDFFKENNVNVNKIKYSNEHHLFHAFSGFYFSNCSEASVIVVDGWGKGYKINDHVVHETTSLINISLDKKNNFYTNLHKQFFYNPYYSSKEKIKNKNKLVRRFQQFLEKELDSSVAISFYPDIGFAYHLFTNTLKFGFLEEGKTMGLSTYGNYNKNFFDVKNYSIFNLEKRKVDDDKFSQFKFENFREQSDIAFFIQKTLEQNFKSKIKKLSMLSPSKNVILSGGCALNVINNSVVANEFSEYNVFVDPLANDSSISLGAAYYFYLLEGGTKPTKKPDSIFWGPSYTNNEILDSIYNYSKI